MLSFRSSASFLLRFETRSLLALLFQEPPRITSDSTPIRQRELRKQLLAQTPGIPGGRVPNPRVNSRSNLLPGRGAFSKRPFQVPQPPAESDHVFPHQPRFFRKQPQAQPFEEVCHRASHFSQLRLGLVEQ